MSEYLVISSSLRPGSHSQLLGRALAQELGDAAEHISLREYPLPLCDGDTAYSNPNVAILGGKITAARVILVSVPVYNYDANSAVKNLVELTGSCWEDKIVGFACAAGGHSSYMSIMSLANSLMLDFRCVILPRFIYATGRDFADGQITSGEINKRIAQLAGDARKLRVGG